MTGQEMFNIIHRNVGMGGLKPRAYCGMKSGAWCNAYVCYAFNQAGQKKLFYGGKKVTYCPTSIKWCKANLAEIPLYLAMPCDVIYFDWQPNGTPDHIGFVKAKHTTDSIFTHEGNTSGGKVAEKERKLGKHCRMWVFRMHFAPTGLKKEKLTVDGDFGYKSIYNLQCALGMKKPDGILGKGTVKALQKKCGASPDGAWGIKTSIKVQKMVGASADGAFGKNSVKALQKWINNKNYPAPKKAPVTKKTATATKTPTTAKKTATTAKKAPVKASKTPNADKLLKKAAELAWAYGTPAKKYSYKSGAPKAKCKAAMKKYGWASNKAELSDCGNFVSTIVRQSGVNKAFKALHAIKTPFPKTEKGFDTVLKGKKIPAGFLKPGDLIRYKKTNGKQHAMMYYGGGKVCEASHKNRFGAIVKDTKRYNTQSKQKTIQVLRAKEK